MRQCGSPVLHHQCWWLRVGAPPPLPMAPCRGPATASLYSARARTMLCALSMCAVHARVVDPCTIGRTSMATSSLQRPHVTSNAHCCATIVATPVPQRPHETLKAGHPGTAFMSLPTSMQPIQHLKYCTCGLLKGLSRMGVLERLLRSAIEGVLLELVGLCHHSCYYRAGLDSTGAWQELGQL